MIWVVILGLIAGYREVIILCDRESWSYQDFRKWFWWTPKDRLSAFKVSNGLYALVLCISLATCTNLVYFWLDSYILSISISIILNWILYMYARNLAMHVVLPLKPDWRYLIPLIVKS